MAISVKEQLLTEIERLSDEQRRQVLAFTRTLQRPKGETGMSILRAARDVNISKEDLLEMQRTIEADTENIDADSW